MTNSYKVTYSLRGIESQILVGAATAYEASEQIIETFGRRVKIISVNRA